MPREGKAVAPSTPPAKLPPLAAPKTAPVKRLPPAASAKSAGQQRFSLAPAPESDEDRREGDAKNREREKVSGATWVRKAPAMGPPPGFEKFYFTVQMGQAFEECLEARWWLEDMPEGFYKERYFKQFVVELALDLGREGNGPRQPAKNATIKRMPMGTDCEASIQNMPEGRSFLLAVAGHTNDGAVVRSPWIQATTLSPQTREKQGNIDPMGQPRTTCNRCPCIGYVPFIWELNTPEKMRCRRCGCPYTDHVAVEATEILRKREDKLLKDLKITKATVSLPSPEALAWDNRECALWFFSDGQFHPREAAEQRRVCQPCGAPSGGKKGRVSVITPTTDARHRFHKMLWHCFQAQSWPDKELVIVETYTNEYSTFFDKLAKEDPRLVYVKFQRPLGQDWSIGLKRNIGQHLATGEYLANFDDDDLYSPVYLKTLIDELESQRAQVIKLSSWYIHDMTTRKWGYCDPVAWGLTKGLDALSQDVRNWVYGYGFSYVYRRSTGLEFWYDNINLGEDFGFIMNVQQKRGERSIVLFHDDFGICVHIQHGGNTSNSIPLREVSREEAFDLEITELAALLKPSGQDVVDIDLVNAGSRLWATDGLGGGSASIAVVPPSQRQRRVSAHLATGNTVEVECAVGVNVVKFLACLENELGESCSGLHVFRVPPAPANASGGTDSELSLASASERSLVNEDKEEAARAFQVARDEMAADVLGIAFLAKQPGAKENLQPHTRSGLQWRKLLEEAKRPMRDLDRIGLRTTDLWVLPPLTDDREEVVEEMEFERMPQFELRVDIQSSTAKAFFSSSRTFNVRLPSGWPVAYLRGILAGDMPAKAKVLVERGEHQELHALLESDPLPERVIISEFTGKRTFYAWWSREHSLIGLRMMEVMIKMPERQRELDDFQKTCNGNEFQYRALLFDWLQKYIYPPIMHRFGFPDDDNGRRALVEYFGNIMSDWELCEQWLKVETMMKNKVNAGQAYELCSKYRRERGITEMPPSPQDWGKEAEELPKLPKAAQDHLNAVKDEISRAGLNEEAGSGEPNQDRVGQYDDDNGNPIFDFDDLPTVLPEDRRALQEKDGGSAAAEDGTERGQAPVAHDPRDTPSDTGSAVPESLAPVGTRSTVQPRNVWRIVGGEDRGGVLVRTGQDLASPKTDPDRISHGALVREIALKDARLQFEKLTGSGPQEGWICTHLDQKDPRSGEDRRKLLAVRQLIPLDEEGNAGYAPAS